MSVITGVRHPYWTAKEVEWTKWRAVYDGGPNFVDNYLEKFSSRESKSDFEARKRITPTPNFAKAAVNDVRNAIYQRLVDVQRRDGSKSYQDAVLGKDFGIDLQGSSMNAFIGTELLIELLVMSRVGVFVDMPRIEGATLRDMVGVRPYLYKYRAEDILAWREKPGRPDEYVSVLLRDYVEVCYGDTQLPSGIKERFRHIYLNGEGKCQVDFYEELPPEYEDGSTMPIRRDKLVETILVDIDFIPFVMVDISDSLLSDVANHQIALLNLESSDINYSLKSNFPFYVEQIDPKIWSNHIPAPGAQNADGTAAAAAQKNNKEVEVGSIHGRTYSKDLNAPTFINPSSEPLKASMEKQQRLKDDIRTLVNLNLSNIGTKLASAESKQMDERGLESGLSSIGLVLEHCERRIEFYWRKLERSDSKIGSIKYPEKWSLKTDADRREDAKHMRELRSTIPSATFQKSVSKEIVRSMLGPKISNADLDKILKEIDTAKSYTAEPETIFEAIDRGAIDLELAAELMGWPIETVKKAADQHAERAMRIAEAQATVAESRAGARGVEDMDAAPGQSGKDEKADAKDQTTKDKTSKTERGDGKEDAKL